MQEQETSPRMRLDKAGLRKIAVGASVALGGALLTYWQQTSANIDFGQYTPIVVALNGVLINVLRKLLTDYSA